MVKVALLTDSSADLTTEEALKHGIHIIRMPLTIDGVEFLEEEEISRDELIAAMKSGKSVGTSQPNLGRLIAKIDDLLKTHDKVVFVPISSKLSGTYQTAMVLSEDYNGRLVVLDTKLVSAPLFALLCDMRRLLDEGMELDNLKAYATEKAYMFATLIPEDIVYLKRGGRISPAAAAVANLLKIIPVLSVEDGAIDLFDKVRTYKKAIKAGLDEALKHGNKDDYYWYIVDGDADPEIIASLSKDMEKELGIKPEVHKLFPIILAHTGPGSIAITCGRKL